MVTAVPVRPRCCPCCGARVCDDANNTTDAYTLVRFLFSGGAQTFLSLCADCEREDYDAIQLAELKQKMDEAYALSAAGQAWVQAKDRSWSVQQVAAPLPEPTRTSEISSYRAYLLTGKAETIARGGGHPAVVLA